MADLMCPTLVVCLVDGDPAMMTALRVARVYASQVAHQRAKRIADVLGVPVEPVAGLADPGPTPLRAWLADGDLTAQAANGETGDAVLARVGGALAEIAERHRGQTVAVVADALDLPLSALSAGLSPAHVCANPLTPDNLVLVEYDAEGWHYLSGWPA